MRKLFLILAFLPLFISGQTLNLNNINESTYIDFKLFRKDAAGNPATVWMLGFDVHFALDKFGTPDEFPSH